MLKNKIAVMVNAKLTKKISRKQIFGKDHLVVEGAGSIIGDTVMNGIYYPLEVVKTLANEDTGIIHAPLSHPVDAKGNFISASSPEGVNQGYVGAISYNYRMQDDRLIRDIAIDIEIANQTERGRNLLAMIENGEDIDTSTGLLAGILNESGIGKDGERYTHVAEVLMLDHDAILVDEQGAATSLQGVGMFANAKGGKDEIVVDTVIGNASMPVLSLDVYTGDNPFDKDGAIERIKEFTNSQNGPSSNYRRFFALFDRDDTSNFDGYKLPFADVIDGVPYAMPEAIEAVKSELKNGELSEQEKSSINDIVSAYSNKKGYLSNARDKTIDAMKGFLENMFGFVENNGNALYNAENKEKELNINQAKEDLNMKDFIVKTLNAAGVKTDGLSEEQLQAAFNENFSKKETENMDKDKTKSKKENMDEDEDSESKVTANALQALAEQVGKLEAKLNSTETEKLEDLAARVEGLGIGINKESAIAMGVDGMNNVLKANKASVSFNVNTRYEGHDGSAVTYNVPE